MDARGAESHYRAFACGSQERKSAAGCNLTCRFLSQATPASIESVPLLEDAWQGDSSSGRPPEPKGRGVRQQRRIAVLGKKGRIPLFLTERQPNGGGNGRLPFRDRPS